MKKALPAVLTALCALAALLCALTAAGLFDAPEPSETLRFAPLTQTAQTVLPERSEGKININAASAEELMTLPGIGRGMAEKIIETREKNPFYFIEDIKNVPGIGDRRMEQLRPYITVGAPR